MAVFYACDVAVKPSLGMSAIEADLKAWLSDQGAALESGAQGHLRLDFREAGEADDQGCLVLTVQDTAAHDEWRIRVLLDGTTRRVRVEGIHAGVDEPDSPSAPPSFLDGWLDQEPSDEQPAVLVAADHEDRPAINRLLEELRAATVGMATAQLVESQVAAEASAGARLPCDGRPGSVVLTGVHGKPPTVIPSTVALRAPQSAARRVVRALVSAASLSPDLVWDSVDKRVAAMSPGAEEAYDELIQIENQWVLERNGLLTQLQHLETAQQDAALELAENAERIDTLESQVRLLSRELAKLQVYPVAEPEADQLDLLPDSVVETLRLGRELLPFLVITADERPALDLDEHPHSLAWSRSLWTLMRGLNSYAGLVAEGARRPGLADYCRNVPHGAVGLPFGRVAMRESEPTMNDSTCLNARVFTVPEYVNEEGCQVMWPHLKISSIAPAPRAHFLDESGSWGKVIIGYVGRHLPTAG